MDYKWSVSYSAINVASMKRLSEYETASKRLGEVPDDYPDVLYTRRNSPVFDIMSNLLGELPLVCSLPFFYNFPNLILNSFILGILRLFRTGLSYQAFLGFYCHHSTIIKDSQLVTRSYFKKQRGVSKECFDCQEDV